MSVGGGQNWLLEQRKKKSQVASGENKGLRSSSCDEDSLRLPKVTIVGADTRSVAVPRLVSRMLMKGGVRCPTSGTSLVAPNKMRQRRSSLREP